MRRNRGKKSFKNKVGKRNIKEERNGTTTERTYDTTRRNAVWRVVATYNTMLFKFMNEKEQRAVG